MFAMSLALMATRGWSFRSWRAYPKYGTTAVVRAALARRAASIRNSSSIQFSAGGLVGWMMNTSRPRTFSSILTKISPSAKWRIVTAHSGCPRCCAISSASGRLAVPARAAHREAARRPGGAGRPGRVRLPRRREPRRDDGPQSLEVARDPARIGSAAVQDPRLRPSRERVALLAAGHVYALDAVGLKRGDPLVAPVVHASPPVHELGQAPAPQIHVGVAGAAHVDARVDRAPRPDDELQ